MVNAGVGCRLSPNIALMSHGGFHRLGSILAATALALATASSAYAATPPATPTPLPPLLSGGQQTLYQHAFEALDAGRTDEAKQLAHQGTSKLGDKVFRWLVLQ